MRIQNISLLGLLAMMTCAAIGVSHAITSYRLRRANAELATLRQRLELISVVDTHLIAARRLPSSDPNVQRWTVRVPSTNSKCLYANWGSKPLSDIRDLHSKSIHLFQLAPDPSTHETAIVVRVERNPGDSKRGTVTFEIGTGTSVIAIDHDITSLLMGEVPCSSSSIGDSPTTRPTDSLITLLEIESNQNPKSAFCLWLDQSVAPQIK